MDPETFVQVFILHVKIKFTEFSFAHENTFTHLASPNASSARHAAFNTVSVSTVVCHLIKTTVLGSVISQVVSTDDEEQLTYCHLFRGGGNTQRGSAL